MYMILFVNPFKLCSRVDCIKYCNPIISWDRHFHVPEQNKSIRWH